MARKVMPAPDTSRKLVSSKIWNGAIYSPGMEAELPEDFPEDGPHWEDFEPDATPAPKGVAAVNLAAQEQEQAEVAAAQATARASTRKPAKKQRGRA